RLLNRKVRVNQRVVLTDKKCPSCGGTEVTQWKKGKKVPGYSTKRKKAFDLVFTSGGIKRKVIECRTSVHQCCKCGAVFIPDRYQRLAKHFHGLVSWAIYNHVAHRVSCSTLSGMIEEFFDLVVDQSELHIVKAMTARYYRPCYKRLLDKICSSAIL